MSAPDGIRATKHGAYSEARIKPVARTQKRRLLRQIGLSAIDLDSLGRAYLDNWARAQAKVELMDRYAAEHGWLDGEGNPPAFTKVYFAALNTARLALGGLERNLAQRQSADALSLHLAEHYGDGRPNHTPKAETRARGDSFSAAKSGESQHGDGDA